MVVGENGMHLETALSIVEWEVYRGLTEHVIIQDPKMGVNPVKEKITNMSPVIGTAVQVYMHIHAQFQANTFDCHKNVTTIAIYYIT